MLALSKGEKEEFDPKIVAFCCNWCSYAGADLAGVSRLGSDRLRLEWISASEGMKFAEVVRDFTEKIKELGPSPLRKN